MPSDSRSHSDSHRSDDRRGGSRGERSSQGRRPSGGSEGSRYRSRDDKPREGYGRRDERTGGSGRGRDDRRDDRHGGDDRRTSRSDSHRGRDDRRGGRDDRRGGRPNDRRDSRGSRDRRDDDHKSTRQSGPQHSGYREERIKYRQENEPPVADDIQVGDLDPSIIQDLRSLSKPNAEMAAKHMIMSATLMAEDPQRALQHARAAKERGGRVAVIRETCGIAAYHAGEWKEALAELRAARRISGDNSMLPVMVDCERGLGRPEKALELGYSPAAEELSPELRCELAIVLAGAHRDLGDLDSALIQLESLYLNPSRTDPEAGRVFYAYADLLSALGRAEDAIVWFKHAQKHDPDETLDCAERIEALGGKN